MDNFIYFFGAYLLLWLLPFGMIAYIFLQTKKIESKIKQIEEKLS